MSEFAIGQKIVCVCDDWKNAFFGSVRETGERYPVKDGVYTVIGHDWLLLADLPGVMIAEVNNDCIWAEQNFRPRLFVTSRSSDRRKMKGSRPAIFTTASPTSSSCYCLSRRRWARSKRRK